MTPKELVAALTESANDVRKSLPAELAEHIAPRLSEGEGLDTVRTFILSLALAGKLTHLEPGEPTPEELFETLCAKRDSLVLKPASFA